MLNAIIIYLFKRPNLLLFKMLQLFIYSGIVLPHTFLLILLKFQKNIFLKIICFLVLLNPHFEFIFSLNSYIRLFYALIYAYNRPTLNRPTTTASPYFRKSSSSNLCFRISNNSFPIQFKKIKRINVEINLLSSFLCLYY